MSYRSWQKCAIFIWPGLRSWWTSGGRPSFYIKFYMIGYSIPWTKLLETIILSTIFLLCPVITEATNTSDSKCRPCFHATSYRCWHLELWCFFPCHVVWEYFLNQMACGRSYLKCLPPTISASISNYLERNLYQFITSHQNSLCKSLHQLQPTR